MFQIIHFYPKNPSLKISYYKHANSLCWLFLSKEMICKWVMDKKIQLRLDETARVLNKHYINEVTLIEDNRPLKGCCALG